jgi:RND family efflux transporter MFP subunit
MRPVTMPGARRRGRAGAPAIALAILVAGCGAQADATGDGESLPTPVGTVTVTASRYADPVRTSGVIASRSEMSLTFKVPGYVGEVSAAEGDRVRADQVLARLRTDEVDARVRAAEAQQELATGNLGRVERLLADSVATQAMLDQARDAFERARAELAIARFDQASATIRAPADGRVLERMIEVAELVGPGTPAFRFGATVSGWVVRVGVPDRQVVRLALGDSAVVVVPALGSQLLDGRVTRIADAANPTTGTFEVEVTVASSVEALRSGMVARVTLMPLEPEALSFLPIQALVDTEGLAAAVFVVEGERVRRHAVEVVRIGPESVGVRAPGLEGATVVTDGAAYLRDGERVEDRTADVARN